MILSNRLFLFWSSENERMLSVFPCSATIESRQTVALKRIKNDNYLSISVNELAQMWAAERSREKKMDDIRYCILSALPLHTHTHRQTQTHRDTDSL